VAKITLGNIEMNFFIIPTQPLHCSVFVREHGVHAGPKDYFVVVVVIRGSI
jgi:hypothetical protein